MVLCFVRLLLGNRPYWWVWLHTDWPHLLHQTSVTCETGPGMDTIMILYHYGVYSRLFVCFLGNPSGHVMITLAVLLTCADHVAAKTSSDRKGIGGNYCFLQSHFRRVVWLIVTLIAISRLLISAHFLHQIVCGVVVGLLLHAASGPCLRPLLAPPTHWRWILGVAPLMIALGLLLFQIWTWLGMDPGFSIPLAKRYI